jgi:hypothetical protein
MAFVSATRGLTSAHCIPQIRVSGSTRWLKEKAPTFWDGASLAMGWVVCSHK